MINIDEKLKELGLSEDLQKLNPKDGEPILRPIIVVGLIGAGLKVGTAFGLDLSEEQNDSITTFLLIFVPVVAGVWARLKGWSPKSVSKLVYLLRAAQREGVESEKIQ